MTLIKPFYYCLAVFIYSSLSFAVEHVGDQPCKACHLKEHQQLLNAGIAGANTCLTYVLVGNGLSPYQEQFCRILRPDFFTKACGDCIPPNR